MSKDFDIGSMFQVQGSYGLDSFFAREPQMITPSGRRKVASIQDLSSFIRLSNDTLIHKSEKDLWAIKREADGSMVIERQFDDNGKPLRY
jgi:hypothetical protein